MDILNSSKDSMLNGNADTNYDVVLSNCNAKLTKWDEDWRVELKRGKPQRVWIMSILTQGFSQRGQISHFISYFFPIIRQAIPE
jgi:hypothetical protein